MWFTEHPLLQVPINRELLYRIVVWIYNSYIINRDVIFHLMIYVKWIMKKLVLMLINVKLVVKFIVMFEWSFLSYYDYM